MVETADKIFVVMELIQGGELFEYLLDRGPLPEAAAVHIMRQVGAGVCSFLLCVSVRVCN